MPTNQEWLHKLANESPDELKAWFDAEHNDNLAAEKVVSCDAAHSNDGKVDTREQLATWAAFAQTHEGELLNEVRVKQAISDSLSEELEELREAFDEICKCAHIPTDWKPIFAAGAVTGTIEGAQKLVSELQDQVDRLQRRNDELRTSYDKLKRERDNLADDLLACNREREQLREHLGIALDHAHDICSLVDIDGNVLDVGD